jgi:hypothetical protein
LSEAPEDKLSLHALAKDVCPTPLYRMCQGGLLTIGIEKMMQFKYTMDGLIVHDVRSANGNIHFRVVGSLLRSNLMHLHQGIHASIEKTFAAEILSARKANNGE